MTAETRDPYTAGHQRRVADLARAIALEMNLPLDMIDGIHMAAAIHDLGKISVPAEILSKPTKLLDIEFMLIKIHSQCGYDILKDIDFPWPVARTVLEHHERMNGSGYPNGLTGDKILMEARILSVADVVESMASHRPYRPALGIKAALNEISKNKGILYDPGPSEACLRLFHEKELSVDRLTSLPLAFIARPRPEGCPENAPLPPSCKRAQGRRSSSRARPEGPVAGEEGSFRGLTNTF